MLNGNGHIYEFGDFRVDPAQRRAFRNGEDLRLPPKTFELLVFLLERSNQVIGKETLMAEVWQDAFVEEANLTVHISHIRKLLSADEEDSASIENFPKVGYRFNADVKVRPNGAGHNGHDGSLHAETRMLEDRKARSRLPLIAGVSALILMIGAGGFIATRFLTDRGRAAMTMTRIPGTEKSSSIAISPDGEYLAHAVSKGGKRTLMMTHLRSSSSVELQPASGTLYYAMVFSPDIRWLYFVSGTDDNADLYKVAILGGPVVRVLENVHHSVDISPDGTRFCFTRRLSADETAILTAAIDGTDVRVLATRSRPERFATGDISWSPDGRTLATALNTGPQGQPMQIVGVDVETGEIRPLANRTWAGVDGFDWLPDGKALLVGLFETGTSITHLWLVDVGSGEAKKITSDLTNYGGSSVTADGQTILTGEHTYESSIWLVPLDDPKSTRKLTDEKHHRFQWVRWTADGKILFASDHGGMRNIWVMNEDGTGARGLTENSGSNFHPVATVDGRYIVFTSNREEPGVDIWRMGASGESPTRLTSGVSASHPSLTPDGRWIYFTGGGEGAPRSIWKVATAGGEPLRVLEGPSQWPAVSQDGKYLAAYRRQDQKAPWSVAIVNIDGNSLKKTLPISAGTPIRWTPDGQGIAYVLTEATVSNIWIQPLNGSPARQLTNFTEDEIVNFDISSDGRLICSRTAKIRDAYLIRNFR